MLNRILAALAGFLTTTSGALMMSEGLTWNRRLAAAVMAGMGTALAGIVDVRPVKKDSQ